MTARILLAEDNDALAQMLQTFLAAQGCQVATAGTGVRAMQLLAGGDFDLLLLDLRLPELNGIEILQKLRKSPKWADFPVIVMSGVYKGERYVEGARRLGVRHYLEKPFTRQAFLQAVQSTLSEINARRGGTTVLDLLLEIYDKRRSGILSLPKGAPVVVLNGEPVSFVSRGNDAFAAHLAGRGKLSPPDRQMFLESGEERLFLTQAGILTLEELTEESRLFLTQLLLESLDGHAGATFTESSPAPEFPLAPLSLPNLLYEAVKSRAPLLRGTSFTEEHADTYPVRTRLFYRRANLVTMGREDIDLLARMDGRTTVRRLVEGASSAVEAGAFLRFLHLLDMVELHEAPTAEAGPDFPQKTLFNRPLEETAATEDVAVGFEDLVEEVSGTVELAMGSEGMAAPLSSTEIGIEQAVQREFATLKDKNYYEIFGLTRQNFSFNALKEAYFARTRQYSPEKFMELSGTTQTLAQEILSVYANAYNTLSNVVAKERYDEMLNADTVGLNGKQDDRLQAKIQFQSGKVFLDMGEHENAEKALQDAYTLEPENPIHCAYLAWAIYNNPANKDSRAAQEKARTLLSKAVQFGKIPEAFAFRGWMLLEEGRDGLAEGEFQKALKLNPRDAVARKGLKLIADRREQENKGFFRKIFR